MIALNFNWHGRDFDAQALRRFTASLGAGIAASVGHHHESGVLLAATCKTPADARRWQASPLAGGGLALFDGYIDNDDALRRELGLPNGPPGDLYAAGYARWGDAVDLRVIGQFATVLVWPEERRVRCVRSPFNAPPLHYWHDRDRFMIASSARVLFSTGEVKEEVDEQKIADSLYLNYSDAERGWFKGVRRVVTGTQLVATPDRIVKRSYYDIDDIAPVRFKRDEEYVEAANALLLEGTRAAMKGFSNPAVSVSGGLDSQAVAASAIEVLGPDRRLLGLTGVPEPGWDGEDSPYSFGDERHHVAALAAMYPTLDTETIDAAGLSFDHKLSAMFLMAGAPPRNAMNLHWIHALHARAKERGCDLLLMGTMGNATFSYDGSGALPSWLVRGKWIRLAREIAALKGERSFARTFASQAVLPLLPSALFQRLMRGRGTVVTDPFATWCGMNPAYAEEMRVRERTADSDYDAYYQPVRSSNAYRHALLDNTPAEAGDIGQAMTLIHGVARRDPTAYRPLAEFCFSIPDDQYLRGGERRWLARRMLCGRIPKMVVEERRLGKQAADSMLRLRRQKAALVSEIDALIQNPDMAHRFDLVRLKERLITVSSASADDRETLLTVQYALPRVLATARFIRFVEGRNAP